MSKEHADLLEEIQTKFVNKTYQSKNFTRTDVEIDLDNLTLEAKKIKLNYGGVVKFKDENGKRLPEYEKNDEEEVLLNNYCALTGLDNEVFLSKDGLVFGLIPKTTFYDALSFEKDWKVRLYALEEICKLIKTADFDKDKSLKFNITRFLY